jgi:hypothetical protein
VPEGVEDLETNPNSFLKWDILLVGPFDLNVSNCTALLIPFTVETSTTNLYFVTDGVAKSYPLVLYCPSNIVVNCGEPVVYAPASFSGCGDVKIEYNPLPNTTFPVGTTPVTVTATDKDGNTTNCVFTVTVLDKTPPVKPTLASITDTNCTGLPVTPPIPSTTDSCMGTIFGTTTTTFPVTNRGTTVVTWTFDDGNGNKTTADQSITISGLSFVGFYAPISGTNGTCAVPLRTINQGSIIPVKFDTKCGSTLVTGGTPPVVKIQAYSNTCAPGSELVSVNAVYQNNWHYNWDTSGWAKGVYRVVVILPDGTFQYAFVKLK